MAMRSRSAPTQAEVSKALNRRKATRVQPVPVAEVVPEVAAAPVVVSSGPVSAEPVNMASAARPPDRFAGYERNSAGLVVLPDDDTRMIDRWYQQGSKVTDLAGLLVLFNELNTLYQHSYNSYIHAVTVMSSVMGRLMDMSTQGPADDFQRQMIGFTLLRVWHGIPVDEPLKMFRFNDLLTQGAANVRTFHMVDEYQGNWLRRRAMERLTNTPPSRVHPDVRRYWQSLAGGAVPPGFVAMKPNAPLPENKQE